MRITLNPDRPLDLGFARVNLKGGGLVTSPQMVGTGDALELTFKGEQKLEVVVSDGHAPPATSKPLNPTPVKTKDRSDSASKAGQFVLGAAAP